MVLHTHVHVDGAALGPFPSVTSLTECRHCLENSYTVVKTH